MKENPYKVTWKFCIVSTIILQLFGWIFMYEEFVKFGIGWQFLPFIILINIIGLVTLKLVSDLAWVLSTGSH